MSSGPCSPLKLHDLARTLRQNAGETALTEYVRLMTHAAEELEEMAAKMQRRIEGGLRPGAEASP